MKSLFDPYNQSPYATPGTTLREQLPDEQQNELRKKLDLLRAIRAKEILDAGKYAGKRAGEFAYDAYNAVGDYHPLVAGVKAGAELGRAAYNNDPISRSYAAVANAGGRAGKYAYDEYQQIRDRFLGK
jgi:hypothetical protein